MTRLRIEYDKNRTLGSYVEFRRYDSNEETTKLVANEIHDYLAGNEDYIANNIVLNRELTRNRVTLLIIGECNMEGVSESIDVLTSKYLDN